jgi:hypothetical protein
MFLALPQRLKGQLTIPGHAFSAVGVIARGIAAGWNRWPFRRIVQFGLNADGVRQS